MILVSIDYKYFIKDFLIQAKLPLESWKIVVATMGGVPPAV